MRRKRRRTWKPEKPDFWKKLSVRSRKWTKKKKSEVKQHGLDPSAETNAPKYKKIKVLKYVVVIKVLSLLVNLCRNK